jgi:YesN/AraC family two-component response regulator
VLRIFNKREDTMAEVTQQVMIVEDDLLLLMVEERLVNNLGYNVVAKASEGQQALRLFREINPDILIVDINLAGELTGIDIVNQLKIEGSDVPVIFLSGENDHHMIDKAKNTGCVDYLLKPITAAGLKKSLHRATLQKNSKQVAA